MFDAHLDGHKKHSTGTAVDHVLKVCTMDGDIAWNTISNGKFKFIHSMEDAKGLLSRHNDSSTYEDYHAWCFTPHSFRLMIEDLFNLGLITAREGKFIPIPGFKFFMVLGRKGEGPKLNRLELISKMKQELSHQASLDQRFYSKMVRLGKRLISRG